MQRIYIDLNSEGLKLQSITKTNNIITQVLRDKKIENHTFIFTIFSNRNYFNKPNKNCKNKYWQPRHCKDRH